MGFFFLFIFAIILKPFAPKRCACINMLSLLCLLFLSSLSFNPTVFALISDGATLLSLSTHWVFTPPSLKTSWNASDSTPCSSWVGVKCDRRNRYVIALDLAGHQISGQLGPELPNLTHLKSLDLSYNSFSGFIPLNLGNCSLLESLDLSNNYFSGTIPNTLGRLQNLNFLALQFNSLTGSIPQDLFGIPQLGILYLNSNQLEGSIPATVGNASLLSTLWVSKNNLSGEIPWSIGNCSSLQELYMSNNQLVGGLPEIINRLVYLDVSRNNLDGSIPFGASSVSCKQIIILGLSFNRFDGHLPSALGNCSNLVQLGVASCRFTGPIPSSLGLLTKLTILHLSANSFTGKIPADLGNCRSLVNISLFENQLEGEIPSGFGMMQNLKNFFLYSNQLTGELPTNFWKIQSLENVLVYDNYLSGELPSEMAELKQLRNVSLFNNRFSGVIPRELGVNSNLTQLDLTNNSFTGEIPPNICLNKQLSKLLLGFNHLQGSIPPDVGSCSSLTRLILKENNLSGVVPFFAENENILYMHLGGNSLTGTIPSSMGNLTGIREIDLSMNRLTGVVPHELFGNLVYLGRLNLSHNRLEGLLPSDQLSNCTELFELDLAYNLFNGSIPSFAFRTLKKLFTLNLNDNNLVGGIPAFLLSQMESLSNLQLGRNMLGGSFPSIEVEAPQYPNRLNVSWNGLTGEVKELGRFSELEELDISHNNLTGLLTYIGGIGPNLVQLNVSYNDFSGEVPEKLLMVPNSFPYSFVGNTGLCVRCLDVLPTINNSSCRENAILKTCSRLQSGNRRSSITKIALIAFGLSVVLISLVGCLICFIRRKGKKQDDSNFVEGEEGASSELNRIMVATENLDDKYLIGRGAHGKVYKVSLPSPDHVEQGEVVHYAAKKLVFSGSIRKSMVREIETVGRVRHRNLLKLENFWLRKEYGLILYQYMENGSLHDVLHETSPPQKLDWNVRYRIAIGVANGLSYLHHDCDPPIVHRDIKPMNILLDSEMEPHISDFGIAKLLLLNHQSTTPIQSNAVLGTIGYIAPENAYSINNFKSMESDVYSYGVVLLELITRKKALDPYFSETSGSSSSGDIVGWVRSVWSSTTGATQEEVEEVARSIVDSSMMQLINHELLDKIIGMLLVALRCTENEPKQRPTMREVVKLLQKAKY